MKLGSFLAARKVFLRFGLLEVLLLSLRTRSEAERGNRHTKRLI